MDTPHVPTLTEVHRSQLTRLDIVHLLNDPNVGELIEGCFVRVLLEIETGREDYRIFTIRGVGRGAVYTGFSSDPTTSTDLYIDLNLPQDLRGINGIAFQLNSVSNSRITQQEYSVWCLSPGPQPNETQLTLDSRIARLACHPVIGARRPNALPPSAPRVESASSAVSGVFSINSTVVIPAETRRPGIAATATMGPNANARSAPAPPLSSVPDVINSETALRAVMEELRETYAVFVDPNFEGHTTAVLRTAERDIADYLDQLREAINSQRQTCVVCMDRAPTVVTLPCKHKILCRLCASQVNSCPCCRETAVEVFEPIEP